MKALKKIALVPIIVIAAILSLSQIASAENNTLLFADFSETTGWNSFGGISTKLASGHDGEGISWDSSDFAGVYYQLDVNPGETIRVSAWTYSWSGESDSQIVNEAWVKQRVGIDPSGETNPQSSNVHWSTPAQFVGEWGQIQTEATATNNTVTIYLAADPDKAKPYNQIVFDDVKVYLVSYPLETISSSVGAAPTPDPLIIGLVSGAGTAPGTQGISIPKYHRLNARSFAVLLVIVVLGICAILVLLVVREIN